MDSQEYATKHERLQRLLEQHSANAVWLTQTTNVAWLSGGNRSYIDTATDYGVASLLVTPQERYVLTNTIEGERLRGEEGFAGWEIVAEPWFETPARFGELTRGMRVLADRPQAGAVDVSAELIALRAPLTPPEIERYRELGRDAGAALARVAKAVERGMTEYQIAGMIAREAFEIGAVPTVVLIAADERLQTIRHPLPTDNRVTQTVMMVLCARRQGLIANLTRLVNFGAVSPELQRKMAAVGQIDTTAIATTRPGARIADVFKQIQAAYAEAGFADEWQNHHQGGACSYGSRDYIATPSSREIVSAPQAFAWNPSVPGAKSEDTVLITDAGAEILTPSPDWPMQRFKANGQTIERHGVLER
ncbi:MAG TPA: M24 family metallopeptidase [Herpetosiphonaceae bacterium]